MTLLSVSHPRRLPAAALLAAALCAVACSRASAAPREHPGWELSATHYPTNLAPGGAGVISIDAFDVGAARTSGPITVTDTLPSGVTATQAGEFREWSNGPEVAEQRWDCSGNGPGEAPAILEATVVTCTNDPAELEFLEAGGGAPNTSGPFPEPSVGIAVTVSPDAPQGASLNRAAVVGGGAAAGSSTTDPLTVNPAPTGFGFTRWDGWLSNADGTPDTQAGSHPYEATFEFALATAIDEGGSPELVPAGGEVRNLIIDLPVGFIGDPSAVPQCTPEQLNGRKCPNASQVGILTSDVDGTGLTRGQIYNMVPPPGVAGELATTVEGIGTSLDSSLRTGGDYGMTLRDANTPQRKLLKGVLTLWGVPADATHDPWRNAEPGGCTQEEVERNVENSCGSLGAPPPFRPTPPFLTLPTSCGAPPTFRIHADTWQNANVAEAEFALHDAEGSPAGLSGCERLGFGPAAVVSPETAQTDSPSGLTVEVQSPLGGLADATGISTSEMRDLTLVLPKGFTVNPGLAAGLQACPDSESGLGTQEPPSCGPSTRLGTVHVQSPLLEGDPERELAGEIYLLQSNPPELRLLVAASGDGIDMKLIGIASLCEAVGQVLDGKTCEAPGQPIVRFEGLPQLPMSKLVLSFQGGAQAMLDTPSECGLYTAGAEFTPWSAGPLVSGFAAEGGFALTSGPAGGPCPGSPPPFAPTMTAGSANDRAGAFTSFSLLLQRGDGQQRLEKFKLEEPAGLAGLIGRVPLCREPQAAQGTCPQVSQIGHASITLGPGTYPLVLPQPGGPELPVYLTEPYRGAPFGLSIVAPVAAGPFDLGRIVARAKIEVDPRTAQLTIATDSLPQVLDGIPTDIRSIYMTLDRPGFLFNPTNCSPQELAGLATSAGDAATAPLSSNFGVGSCRDLKFTPKVTASTSRKASKADGASLSFKIAYPAGAVGNQSWLEEVKLTLPARLPTRLTTIQKACIARVFEADPKACPGPSQIGSAVMRTPVLAHPLKGKVYFVSYGARKFPDIVLVLEGDGVRVVLRGETSIGEGRTTVALRRVPDIPLESIEVRLPRGPYSEVAARLPAKSKGSLCGQRLVMPARLRGQNGDVVQRKVRIGVAGCRKRR